MPVGVSSISAYAPAITCHRPCHHRRCPRHHRRRSCPQINPRRPQVLKVIASVDEDAEREAAEPRSNVSGNKKTCDDPDLISEKAGDLAVFRPESLAKAALCGACDVEEPGDGMGMAMQLAQAVHEEEARCLSAPVSRATKAKQVLAADAPGTHLEGIRAGTLQSQFSCTCPLSLGLGSCLSQFSPVQLMQVHKATFGTRSKDHKRLSQGQVKERLHQAMWSLAVALPAADNLGRTHAIHKWKIQGFDVCRKGWECAHGLGERQSRTLYAMVLRGYGPADAADVQKAAAQTHLMDSVRDASGKLMSRKREYAATWWKNMLLLMDFQPNDSGGRIQIRGPGYTFLHEHVYGPAAARHGLKLSYPPWMECMKQGLLDVCMVLPNANPQTLTAGRSARHAKFPECTECQERRQRWHSAAAKVGSDPREVQQLYDLVLEHNKEWQAERRVALVSD